jgi:hypothetical protein
MNLFSLLNKLLVFRVSLILWILLLACTFYQSYFYPPHDFSNSYFAGYFLLRNKFDINMLDPYVFNKQIWNEGFHGIYGSFNPNPPFTAIFFTPFAALPLLLSKLLFNVVTTFIFLLSVYRLCRHLDIQPQTVFICIPVLFLIPIRNEILFGQTYFLIGFLLIEGFISFEKKRPVIAALFWSLAIFIKIFPVIIFLFLVLQKAWRQTLYMLAGCVFLLIISIWMQGAEIWKEFFLHVLPRSNNGEISSAYTTNFQSGLMLFKYLFVEDTLLNPHPFLANIRMFTIAVALLKTTVLTLATLFILRRRDVFGFGLLLLCSLLISPYGSTYSNILLLVLFIALAKEKNHTWFVFGAVLIFLISNLPISLFQHFPVPFRFPRFFLMITFLVFIFISVKISINWLVPVVFLLLFGMTVLFKTNEEDKSQRLISDEKHSLIFNYGLKDNFIFYEYWDENGENTFQTAESGHELKINDVEIMNHQIFYKGKQVTNTSDNKKLPGVLDGKYILYLSDANKGIGFYTIRSINIK